MPRKTPEESAKTRSAILNAALEVFGEKGYSRSTLNGIAQKAGFTRGAVYWHFKDKIDLFTGLAEAIKYTAEGLFKDIDPTSPVELRDLFVKYFTLFETDDRYRRFYEIIWLRTEWSDELTPVLERFREEMHQLREWLEKIFTRLQAVEALASTTNPQLAATSTCAFIEGLVGLRLSDPDQFPEPEALLNMLGHFFNAFASGAKQH
jgi:TetR/AcrR family transcriptional regulator, acrAB operon repressor